MCEERERERESRRPGLAAPSPRTCRSYCEVRRGLLRVQVAPRQEMPNLSDLSLETGEPNRAAARHTEPYGRRRPGGTRNMTVACDNAQPASTAHPPPLTPPSLAGSQSTSQPRKHRASRPPATRIVHTHRASTPPKVRSLSPTRPRALHGNQPPPTQARTAGVLRVASAPAPSFESRRVSSASLQLRARFIEWDGGFASVALRRVRDQRPHHCLCRR